jgi:hypothetical protein
MLAAIVPLKTWRFEVDRSTNGNQSGRMVLIGDWHGGRAELATIPSMAGDITTEDVAAVLTEALDALRGQGVERADSDASTRQVINLRKTRQEDTAKIAELKARLADVEQQRDASRAIREALGRACMTLRLKVEKYLKVSVGDEATSDSWDAWEDMRIALGAFATNDEVRDWEAELFAMTEERDALRAELDRLKAAPATAHQHRFITDEDGCVHRCVCGARYGEARR